jgi:hypothetical protein
MLKSLWLYSLLTCAASASSLANIEASLQLEKQNYLVGKPIILTLTARYTGSAERVDRSDSDPYGQCSPYRIEVS